MITDHSRQLNHPSADLMWGKHSIANSRDWKYVYNNDHGKLPWTLNCEPIVPRGQFRNRISCVFVSISYHLKYCCVWKITIHSLSIDGSSISRFIIAPLIPPHIYLHLKYPPRKNKRNVRWTKTKPWNLTEFLWTAAAVDVRLKTLIIRINEDFRR